MKEPFVIPVLEWIFIEATDIITASNGNDLEEEHPL